MLVMLILTTISSPSEVRIASVQALRICILDCTEGALRESLRATVLSLISICVTASSFTRSFPNFGSFTRLKAFKISSLEIILFVNFDVGYYLGKVRQIV